MDEWGEFQLTQWLLKYVERLPQSFLGGCAWVRRVGITYLLCGEAFGCLSWLLLQLQQAWGWIALKLEDVFKNGSAVPHHGEGRLSHLMVGYGYLKGQFKS